MNTLYDGHPLKKIHFLMKVSLRWIPTFAMSQFRFQSREPKHILFCNVDHYEPGTGRVSEVVARQRVDMLLNDYPKLANNHRDSDGCPPKRTWFFPPHYHRNYYLRDLVRLCEQGYGEIELHLHHGKEKPDTSENLEATITQCIKEYAQFGIFGTFENSRRYGFIHGDWALNNSRGGKFCGVNDEIEILSKTGCYADFTFPSCNEANPSQINSIYYASDHRPIPKSYDSGRRVSTSRTPRNDLMIIQGPLHPFFITSSPLSLRVLGDGINGNPPVDQRRIDSWVKLGIGIEGKDDWIIIKTHTHGATDHHAVLGREMDELFGYLENKYNDGTHYVLHYVSARELYNIIKAAEAGEHTDDMITRHRRKRNVGTQAAPVVPDLDGPLFGNPFVD